MGFPSNGPYNSHRMAISMDYVKTSWVEQNADTGVTCWSWKQIDEDGIYNPGHGLIVFTKGANVISHDGLANYRWEKAHHPSFVNGIQAGGEFSISSGSALTYGASAGVFGITIEATTSHSNEVQQTYGCGIVQCQGALGLGKRWPLHKKPAGGLLVLRLELAAR